MKKILVILIGLLAFGIAWVYQLYVGSLNYSLNPSSDDRVVVNIKKGSTAADVAESLYQKKLINNPTVFRFYLKQQDLADQIKAGRIVLTEDMDVKEIVDALIEGKSQEMAVTILEGWTIKQIAEHLESEGLTTAEDFEECIETCDFDYEFLPDDYLEGYLYPDTYFVDPSSYTDKGFISRMLSTFDNRLSDKDMTAVNASGRTLEEIIIMASIIEREESDSKERPTVAGILWDRFDNQVGLGADATVLYALGRTKGGLTYNDLQIDSPYNTRKYRGLPPTPISNPSITSIRSAIYPQKTDYFYYLHDSEGKVHYAKTLEEHNSNKQKYLSP